MKKVTLSLLLTTFILGGCTKVNVDSQDISQFFENNQEEKQLLENTTLPLDSFKIANWNLKVFGQKKASDPQLMNFYEQTLENNYDIIFIQEIRDKSETAFEKLCSMFEEYNCYVSSRAGQSTSKEQNGIIAKKGIEVEITDYNYGVYMQQFNRPPIAVDFSIGNYTFTAVNIHTDPDVVPEEMGFLEKIVLQNESSGNVMIIGDLNADCAYYNNEKETHFDSWNWLIKDDGDTTLSKNDCSYDRIILNGDMSQEYLIHGVLRDGINTSHSDHYLIWGQFKVE